MSTLSLISLYVNILLGITVLSLVYPKGIRYYRNYKKHRETKREQERQRVKEQIRREVREYLKELQQ